MLTARWAQMKSDYDANPSNPATLGGQIYKYAKIQADVPPPNYFDQIGMWGAIFYQITGDVAYAQRSLAILKTNSFWTSPTVSIYDGNPVREYGQMLVLIYDWIYTGIADPDRSTFRTKLGTLMGRCVNGGPNEGYGLQTPLNTRTGDTDQCTGEWTTLGMWAIVDGGTDGVAESLFTTIGGSAVTPQVALDNPIRHPGSFGNPNPVNARNAMYYYVNMMAKGGQWIEGSHYNMGTLQLLLFGFDCIRAHYPTEDLQDIKDFAEDVAIQQIHFATNDRNQSFQYGDVETNNARNELLGYNYYGTSMMSSLLCADTVTGPYMQRFVLDHMADHGFPFGSQDAVPTPRSFLSFDPYQTAAADYTSVQKSLWMAGQGQLTSRPSWDADDSAFWCQWMPGEKFVHHQVKWNGAFQLYRKAHWALTHPQAYGSGTTGALATADAPGPQNVVRIARVFSFPPWYGGGGAISDAAINGMSRVWSKIATNYVYLCGTAGGPFHPNGQYYNPPPTCLHENTRSIVKLHSTTKDNDVIIVYDRINLVDPRTLPNYTRYASVEQTLMNGATTLKEWMIFSNVATAVGGVTATHGQVFASNGGAITWTDPGGDPVRVDTLLPTDMSKLVHDFSNASIHGTAYTGTELLYWRTIIYPTVAQQWDTFLNVVSAYDNGSTQPTATLITGTANRQGCRVVRTSENDVILMFNGTQGSDLPTNQTANWPAMKAILDVVRYAATGFSFTYTQTTATATVLLFDLDPNHSWTKNVDGAGATSLTVDSIGAAEFTVSGASSHTIVLA